MLRARANLNIAPGASLSLQGRDAIGQEVRLAECSSTSKLPHILIGIIVGFIDRKLEHLVYFPKSARGQPKAWRGQLWRPIFVEIVPVNKREYNNTSTSLLASYAEAADAELGAVVVKSRAKGKGLNAKQVSGFKAITLRVDKSVGFKRKQPDFDKSVGLGVEYYSRTLELDFNLIIDKECATYVGGDVVCSYLLTFNEFIRQKVCTAFHCCSFFKLCGDSYFFQYT